jgi:transcriptional regulator with XRE-family HTH domain
MKAVAQPSSKKPRSLAVGSQVDPGEVLAKATTRAAALLGLRGAALARVIGLSEPTVSRLLRGERTLAPGSKEGELAALLVRVYRSLDALVGNDDGKRAAWLNSHHHALGGVPRELLQTVEGLVATLNYLDGMRATA